jgi:hypothetical protein
MKDNELNIVILGVLILIILISLKVLFFSM